MAYLAKVEMTMGTKWGLRSVLRTQRVLTCGYKSLKAVSTSVLLSLILKDVLISWGQEIKSRICFSSYCIMFLRRGYFLLMLILTYNEISLLFHDFTISCYEPYK